MNKIIFVIYVVVIVLSVSAYFARESKTQASRSSTPEIVLKSITPTAMPVRDGILPIASLWDNGTKEFSDPKLNITFSYPQDLVVEVIDTKKEDAAYVAKYPSDPYTLGLAYVTFQTRRVPSDVQSNSNFDYQFHDDNTARIIMNARDNSKGGSITDYLRREKSMSGIDGKTPVYVTLEQGITPVKVVGLDAYQYAGTGGGENFRKEYFIPYKNIMYEFSLLGGNNTGQGYSKDAEELLDMMVNSIKLK